MARCSLLMFLGLSGCALASSQPLPDVQRAARPSCRVDAALVHCGQGAQQLSALGIALPVQASARRALGGLWLLDARSTLHRIDARGVVTGRYAGPVAQLIMSEELVCVREPTGTLACAIDRHDERGCTDADTLPGFVAVAHAEDTLIHAAPKLLCARDGACLRLARPCETACLRFPSCHAPLRCIDACAQGEPAISAQPLAADSSALFARSVHHQPGLE